MRRITCGRETDHTNWALNARPKAKVNALGPSKKDCGLHVITKPCSAGHPANIPGPNIYIYIERDVKYNVTQVSDESCYVSTAKPKKNEHA